MNYPIKLYSIFLFIFFLAFGLTGCDAEGQHRAHKALDITDLTSYAAVDLSQSTPSVIEPTGTSSIRSLALVNTSGASYRPDYKTWWLTNTDGSGVEVKFDLSHPTMMQLAMEDAFVLNSGGTQSNVNISVNGNLLADQPLTVTNANWHSTVLDIPTSSLKSGTNTILLALDQGSAAWFLKSVKILPRNLYAVDGELTTTLYAQFGVNQDLVGVNPNCSGDKACNIWTRGYGLASKTEMIPGPTLFYNPGDLLTVDLVNKLDSDTLKQFEQGEADNMINPSGGPTSDEILDNLDDKVRQEVNIPHNLNNTNLHVHGLHVDPAIDDVTIVIVPEDESGTVDDYDAPHHVPMNPDDLDQLNEGSVADQAVKPGSWEYQYRIPENHLPGTHWFHPHKHGSTAAQVENGMAGSMVIQEPQALAIFPGQENTEWSYRYDEVMMIQQIANYGLQKGTGGGKEAVGNSNTPVTVINGIHIPKHKLAPGQIVRWRFVNAGANHRAFNHMWMGKNTGTTVGNNQSVYVSHPISAVAFDGITLKEKSVATAKTPFLLAPGNRADIVFQITPSEVNGSNFDLFKYYPTNISIVDPSYFAGGTTGKNISDYLSWDCSNFSTSKTCTSGSKVQPLTAAYAPISNPYLFAPNSENVASGGNTYTENFNGDNVSWINTAKTQLTAKQTPIAPLIKVLDEGGTLALNFALTPEFPSNGVCSSPLGCTGKWQPQLDGFGGGAVKAEKLISITVDTNMTAIGPTALPEDSYLSSISVTGTFSQGETAPGFEAGIPSYVNPFDNNDILQSRPVIFDKSGAAIKVVGTNPTPSGQAGTSSGATKVNQFTLNGRPFALNDMIGNSTDKVNARLSDGVTLSELKRVSTDGASTTSAPDSDQCTATDNTACLDIKESLSFESSGAGKVWTNGVCTSDNCTDDGSGGTTETTYYWANPGYFQGLDYIDDDSTPKVKGYRYAAADTAPSWVDISGLMQPAAVNPQNKYGNVTGNVNGVPGLPLATTGEEWVLINNSDIGHPFHIHINPFFVVEVGQLSYEQFSDKKEWVMRSVNVDTLPNINSREHSNGGSVNQAPQTPGIYQANSDINHFVGNWWDTVIVPPHGYVKVRYWMNVPNQTGEGAQTVVEDDFNKIGIWVYHCHILRHEDRGMMMPVVTQEMMSVSPGTDN